MGPGGPVLRSKFMTEGAPQPASTPGEGIEVPPAGRRGLRNSSPPIEDSVRRRFFWWLERLAPWSDHAGRSSCGAPPHRFSSRVCGCRRACLQAGRSKRSGTGIGSSVRNGGEGPPVYLVHGWGGQRPHLAMFVKPLVEAGYRVVAFDLPSHNESDPGELAPGRTTATECADAIAAVIETHGPAHAVVAHSLGANATALAAAQGAPVGRLVFFAPMGDFPLYLDLFAARHASAAGSARAYTVVWKKSESPCRCMRPT